METSADGGTDKLGFIRENRLANMHVVRQTTLPRGAAQKIHINGELEWEIVSLDVVLSDYITRTDKIDTIVNSAISNRVYGVIIDFREINNEHYFERFLIELTPRLREIGVKAGVRSAPIINNETIRNIVDYIIN